jgi:two-component system, response regulator PdtaR
MSKGNVLIVDDDQTTASVIQLYLKNFGYDVVGIALDGKDSISMARELHPDLVLMDIFLGKGLDGISAAEIISKHFGIAVVFVTAHADAKTLERAKQVEPLGYINKPIRDTDLKTTIELALAKSTPRQNNNNVNASIEEVLMSLYSFTKSEARVTAKLIEFPKLDYVVDSLNISISTARTHIKSIYRKTNTNRLPVLVHKLVTGPVGLLINKGKTRQE